MYDYLIVGNGIAGLKAAESIRKKDENASIVIISKAADYTYWRTKLSELICKDFTNDDILVKKLDWYEKNNIEVKLQNEVEKLDLDSKKAILKNGDQIEYGKALIATGSHPFVPPIKNIDTKGVFAIRTVDDLNSFKKHINENKKVIIIGGGLLGLEAAFSIKNAGCEVLVIETFDYILGKQLDNELSLKLEKELNNAGIETSTGKNTSEILEKDGKVCGIKLEDGEEIEAGTILVQTGVRNDLDVAINSGLKTERGIIVDETLKTSDENVYAAGDCMQLGQATIGLWTASMEMGEIAGSNMTGDNKTYQTPKPFSSLLLGDIKLFSAGFNSGEGIEEVKKEYGEKVYKLFKKDGKYVGGILYKDIKFQNDVKKIVFEGEDPKNTKLGKEIFGM
ncbi:FAD-dependent oxidoreductase [Anaerococcus hydrogenalis]|uniref:NAD(P)/FAD-dependent oxidoreductase n=1 Tax=Anaerococcus hydrogenalis TaxID=33029 RepID=UPI00290154EA|nr:FAD-dependent oxidoreductase [Anaerococcus hydrogenalis]MDU1316485.1 FAD-dependent oxidoreductase [Anaerococcus hydrogenalis]